MVNEEQKSNAQFWREAIKNHWKIMIVGLGAIVLFSIIAIWTVFWHIQTSYIGDYGNATFDEWSLNWIVIFVIVLVLWELLFVGLPAGLLFGLGGLLWWNRLPSEERAMFRKHEEKSNKKKEAGGFGIVMFILYCIYIAIDGNFSAPFGSQPYSYWVFSYFMMIFWLLIIAGIPAAIIGLIYFKKWLNKSD